MSRRAVPFAFALFAIAPFVALSTQQQDPSTKNCEEVFKDIQVFKGVPASELIPMMQFMSTALGMECEDCHKPGDFAADTDNKKVAREMVELQRDINKRYFNNKLEVTCMSCHMGKDHPQGIPMPEGTRLRHERLTSPPKAADLLAKHVAAVGNDIAQLELKGTMTAKDLVDHKVKTNPITFMQASGGKFKIDSAEKQLVSDGTTISFGPNALWGESKAVFHRIGREWRGADAFAGLDAPWVSGKDKVGDREVFVVQGDRRATSSTEELYLDAESGLLLRLVNVRRSPIGIVMTTIEYADYKSVASSMVPMRVTVTFSDTNKWDITFQSAEASQSVNEAMFTLGG